MDVALLAARLLLIGTFAVAGVAKLADLRGSRQALREFGVQARLATPLGVLLPLAELAVAIALIPRVTAWWGAFGALALLLAFGAGIATSLARGRQPDCHCFGQLHSAPAGWPTLARNAGLAAVATFILWQGRDDPGPSMVTWADNLSTAEVVALGAGLLALVLTVMLSWAVIHLLQQYGRLLLRLDDLEVRLAGDGTAAASAPATVVAPERGLTVGTEAPTFTLTTVAGETLSLDTLRAGGKPVLLVFSDPGCGPCNPLMPDLGRWHRQHADRLEIVVVSRGAAEVNRAKASEHGLPTVLVQSDREVAHDYQAYGTPSAVLVRPDGAIGSPLAAGAEAIRALVARSVGSPAPRPTISLRQVPPSGGANGHGGNSAAVLAPDPAVGEPAPALRLPDLNGNDVELSSLKGERTLLLFWNPGCGFCARMLNDLKAWEADPPAGTPRLLVVSTGDVEANRAMKLHSTVVLDQGFRTGRAFGASGTPSAVLVDEDGRIASDVAVGAPAVLSLAKAALPEALSRDG